MDAAVGEVDVAPEHVAELVGARAGEDEGGDDRAAVVGAPVGGAVHLAARVEQGDDLLGGVEVHGPARRELEPAPPAGGGVGGEVPVLDGHGEDPLQDLDGLVDRVGREGSQDAAVVVAQGLAAFDRAAAQVGLLDLVAAVGVDGLDVDRLDRPVGEVGQQVGERPLLGSRGCWR